jgi:hypothetical protein
MDQLAKGIVRVAEASGHLLLRDAVEEDGPQGFVLALQGAGRLLEEASAKGVVHNLRSGCEVILGAGPAVQGKIGPGA